MTQFGDLRTHCFHDEPVSLDVIGAENDSHESVNSESDLRRFCRGILVFIYLIVGWLRSGPTINHAKGFIDQSFGNYEAVCPIDRYICKTHTMVYDPVIRRF